MLHGVKKSKYLSEYKIELVFDDGSVKIIDLEGFLKTAKAMLAPLKDIEYFKKVKCDGTTIMWPNGVDLCPDVLYKQGKTIQKAKRKQRKTASVSSRRRSKLIKF
jgi:hypothetical protein